VTPGQQGQAAIVTYTTTPNVVPEGFVMNVTPQIGESDIINLNVRPSVTRITGYVNDPNPDLARTNVISRVPQIQTREFETMLRVASGQTAVLGGLMQDSLSTNRDGLPILARLPVIGDAVSYRNDTGRKSELVVFLRATVIRDANVESELSGFKRYLPDGQFFQDPSPSIDPAKALPSINGKTATESKPAP
jgi:general secretion pathway protein D